MLLYSLFPLLLRRHAFGLFLFTMMFLSACSQVHPFVDTRREAGQEKPIGYSTPDRSAVCYNPFTADMEEVQRLAEEACQKTNRHAVFKERKNFSCRFLTPSINFYDCQ